MPKASPDTSSWPCCSCICDVQRSGHEEADKLHGDQDGLPYLSGKVWIPDAADDLEL